MQELLTEHQKQLTLANLSLYIALEGAQTVLWAFKESFPREYEELLGKTETKKGVLLDAGKLRRDGTGVANPDTPQQRPSGDKRDKLRSGHPLAKPSGTRAAVAADRKDLSVSDDLSR